jgi:PAS domain S-box-containing protein
VGEDPLEYLHPGECEEVAETFEALGDGVESTESEYRWRAADGSWVWMQTAFRDRRETPVDGYVLTSREIGERKAREQELESRERILEELGDTIYALDENSEYDYINPAGKRISGYSREEILETGPELLHPESDLERFDEVITGLIADDDREVETVEATLETADGEDVPIEVSLTILEEDGEFQGTIGVVRDITERKRRERELLEYQTIVQALPDEVAILNTEGNLTRVIPPSGQELTTTGYEVDELEGEPVTKVMPDEHVETGAELIEELVTTGKERVSFEMELIHKNGTRLEREDHLALVRDPSDGSIVGTVGVLRDIEERKAYERALEERNERLEEFASIVSHDLRNPLNVAKGRLDLAVSESDSEHLDIAIDSIERMETLIEDLLTLAREGEDISEIEPVDLERVSNLSWGHVSAPAASLDVGDLGEVMADENRLQQLLENLYRNAIDHGSEDVSLRVEAIEGGFAVEDDGPGIPPEERDRVFETGYTGGDGTGFGLAIVERVVDAHGWDVTVTEGRDGGARFEITGVERPD